MKATGIVRRMDELGRIVIPKEIRKILRIREGDTIEIFVDKDEQIILKKYSSIGELGDFAQQYAESLHKTSGHVTCITDKDNIIAVSGGLRRELLNKLISPELEKIMLKKNHVITTPGDQPVPMTAESNEKTGYHAQVISPIISEGEPIGSVILLAIDPNTNMGELELKLAQSASGFLGRHMEQ